MENLDLLKIAYITNATLLGKNIYIKNISIDTRKNNIKNSLFIVIKGIYKKKFLCFDAIKKGALALLIDFYLPIFIVPLLIVKNTKIALGKISCWLRKESSSKVICITGSTGKTSTKEIIVNILKQSNSVLYNLYNFNNELGVPISLLNLQYLRYKYIVLELGSNSIGDINYLSKIVLPDISCITNISISHLKGFKKFKNIIIDKGKIFKYLPKNGIAIININYFYYNYWKKYLLNKKKMFYNILNFYKCNVFISDLKFSIFGTYFIINTIYGKQKVFLKLLGIHNISNVLSSIILSLCLEISIKDIKLGLESLLPIKGRLYPIFLNNKKIILDDSYNCNPRSLYFSILFLQKCIGYKLLVISDMFDLSYMSLYCHKYIGLLIKKNIFINKILSIGKYSYYISKYSKIGEHFNSFNKLIFRIKNILVSYNEITILIKGSNIFNMNKIINFL